MSKRVKSCKRPSAHKNWLANNLLPETLHGPHHFPFASETFRHSVLAELQVHPVLVAAVEPARPTELHYPAAYLLHLGVCAAKRLFPVGVRRLQCYC